MVLVVVLVLAILVLVNYFLARHSVMIDLTAAKGPQPLRPIAHGPQGPQDRRLVQGLLPRGQLWPSALENLLKLYAYRSARVSYEFIDPDKNPGLVKRYGITQDGTTILEFGDKRAAITTTSEEDVTNALIKATRTQKKVLFFLEGHGEGTRRGDGRQRLFDGQGRAREARLRGEEADPGPGRPLSHGLRPARRPRAPEGPPAERVRDHPDLHQGRRPGPVHGRSGDADPAAALPRRLRLQARERHRRRHRVAAPRRRLFHACRQRVRIPRDHRRSSATRRSSPTPARSKARRDQARGRDRHGPGQDEPELLVRAGARSEGGQVRRRPRTSRARSAWPRSVLQDQAATPRRLRRRAGRRPRPKRSRRRPTRRPASPSSATPISSRTAITACPATATSSSTWPTG